MYATSTSSPQGAALRGDPTDVFGFILGPRPTASLDTHTGPGAIGMRWQHGMLDMLIMRDKMIDVIGNI